MTLAETPGKVKAVGRHLIGGLAFGCVKCHTFAGNKTEGIQGIDMILMPTRLQRNWFFAYINDPQKLRPGTRMPQAFDKGKSPLSALDGSAAAQIESFWIYLSDGKKAQLPNGVAGKKSILLAPEKNAIVYRNFIEGAGSRAIAVGYPEKVNIRLALLWHGAFIDAGRHWSGRGEGYEPPQGDNILQLPSGPAFAVLAKADEPWPTAPAKTLGAKFAGYRLSPDERPTFRYAVAGVNVEDFPNAVPHGKDIGIRRTLDLNGVDALNTYFRAAVGKKIDAVGDSTYQIDGVRLTITTSTTPIVRSSNGKMELLVPVPTGKSRIIAEYSW